MSPAIPCNQSGSPPARQATLCRCPLALGGTVLHGHDTLPLAGRFVLPCYPPSSDSSTGDNTGRPTSPTVNALFSPTLSGKDAGGQPLRGHCHAYYLPTDEEDDGRIDHVTVFADQGFTADEVQALDRLREVLPRRGRSAPASPRRPGQRARRPVAVVGRVNDLGIGHAVPGEPLPQAARTSDLPEHYATSGTFAAHVLRQELERLRQRRLDSPLWSRYNPWRAWAGRAPSVRFSSIASAASPETTVAAGRGGPSASSSTGRRGDLCAVGHSCHFGLGVFLPEDVARPPVVFLSFSGPRVARS